MIGGRYAVVERLGASELGDAFRVRDERLAGRPAVLLRLRGDASRDLARLVQLNHPNIRSVFDHGSDDEGTFVVLEQLAGQTLEERVRGRGPLDLAELERLARGLGQALAYAHGRRLLHGNLSPKAVWCTPDGEFKLDGWAAAAPAAAGAASERADIDALGPMLRFAATAGSPAAALAGPFAELVALCEHERPQERPRSANEFLQNLRRLVRGAASGSAGERAVECAECAAQNPAGRELCRGCAAELYGPCPRCRARQPRVARECSSCGADVALRRRYEDLLGEVRRHLDRRDFETAIAAAAQAQTLDPDPEEAHELHREARRRRALLDHAREEARSLEGGRHFEAAAGAWERVLEVAPGDDEATAALEELPQKTLEREIEAAEKPLLAALAGRDWPTMRRALDDLSRLSPRSERVRALEERVESRRRALVAELEAEFARALSPRGDPGARAGAAAGRCLEEIRSFDPDARTLERVERRARFLERRAELDAALDAGHWPRARATLATLEADVDEATRAAFRELQTAADERMARATEEAHERFSAGVRTGRLDEAHGALRQLADIGAEPASTERMRRTLELARAAGSLDRPRRRIALWGTAAGALVLGGLYYLVHRHNAVYTERSARLLETGDLVEAAHARARRRPEPAWTRPADPCPLLGRIVELESAAGDPEWTRRARHLALERDLDEARLTLEYNAWIAERSTRELARGAAGAAAARLDGMLVGHGGGEYRDAFQRRAQRAAELGAELGASAWVLEIAPPLWDAGCTEDAVGGAYVVRVLDEVQAALDGGDVAGAEAWLARIEQGAIPAELEARHAQSWKRLDELAAAAGPATDGPGERPVERPRAPAPLWQAEWDAALRTLAEGRPELAATALAELTVEEERRGLIERTMTLASYLARGIESLEINELMRSRELLDQIDAELAAWRGTALPAEVGAPLVAAYERSLAAVLPEGPLEVTQGRTVRLGTGHPIASLAIGGLAAEPLGDGRFQLPRERERLVGLVPRAEVVLVDARGERLARELEVSIDLEGPQLTLASELPESVRAQDGRFALAFDSDTPLAGEPRVVSAEGVVVSASAEGQRLTLDLYPEPVPGGRVQAPLAFQVEVFDALGNPGRTGRLAITVHSTRWEKARELEGEAGGWRQVLAVLSPDLAVPDRDPEIAGLASRAIEAGYRASVDFLADPAAPLASPLTEAALDARARAVGEFLDATSGLEAAPEPEALRVPSLRKLATKQLELARRILGLFQKRTWPSAEAIDRDLEFLEQFDASWVPEAIVEWLGALRTLPESTLVRVARQPGGWDVAHDLGRSVPARLVDEKSGVALLYVPGGTFRMGAAGDDLAKKKNEAPQRTVHVDGFYIAEREVSVAEWRRGAGSIGEGNGEGDAGGDGDADAGPMTHVSWQDAAGWCAALGLELPTEAQWEYAASGPADHRFPWGDRSPEAPSVAGTQAGTGSARAISSSALVDRSWCGTLDMGGGVMEWCRDAATLDLRRIHEGATNPSIGPEDTRREYADWRMVRGGSVRHPLAEQRTSMRRMFAKGQGHALIGVRPAMGL